MYINITITILDIIHRPIFHLELEVSQTGLCFSSHGATRLGPIDIGGTSLWTQGLALSIGAN
jgi:hypothetical protein